MHSPDQLNLGDDAELLNGPRTEVEAKKPSVGRRFDYLPVGMYALVMGLSGLSAAWRSASTLYGIPMWISDVLTIVAVAAFVLLTTAYLAKVVLAFDAAAAEFKHPVTGNLFGTVIISLLLLPVILAAKLPMLAATMWTAGTVAMFGFAWLMINRWISDRQQLGFATPAWIVPVVGLLDVPLASPLIDPSPSMPALLGCLAIGFFFAVVLFTIIFARLLFGRPLPTPMRPALLILVAPFAVGFSAYVAVTGKVDSFATGLYVLMLFMLAVLLGRLRHLARCCPFRVAWWAVSFPLAACASTGIRFASDQPGFITGSIGLALLGLASIVIAALFARTIIGVFRGELRTLSA